MVEQSPAGLAFLRLVARMGFHRNRVMPQRTPADFPEPDDRKAVELVQQMLAIPGPSGQEGKVIAFIQQQLLDAGVPAAAISTDGAHRRSPFGGEIGNLIVKLPGTRRAPRRMLSAHTDTVALCVGCQPIIRGNRIVPADPHTGLGADNRAGSAVVLTAVLEILRQRLPHPPLTLLWSVQEEVGLRGAHYLAVGRLGRPRLAFNFDGGSPDKLTVGANGAYRIEIEIGGIAAHAGLHPEQGVSAVAIAGLAIARLQRQGWHGLVIKGKRRGTSNIGSIRAGQATNVVADRASVRAEVRSHDPQFRQEILTAIRTAFEEAVGAVRNEQGQTGTIQFEHRLDYEAYQLDDAEPCIHLAEAAIRAVGSEPVRAVTDGGIDANWLVSHGIPTVSLGAGQQNVHTVDETLVLPDFCRACRIALRLATAFAF